MKMFLKINYFLRRKKLKFSSHKYDTGDRIYKTVTISNSNNKLEFHFLVILTLMIQTKFIGIL